LGTICAWFLSVGANESYLRQNGIQLSVTE
jgi:hypothetical protein